MAGLTDRDLQRIRRFVETPPRQRTPHILTPDEESEGRASTESAVLEESEGRASAASGALEGGEGRADSEPEPDVEATG